MQALPQRQGWPPSAILPPPPTVAFLDPVLLEVRPLHAPWVTLDEDQKLSYPRLFPKYSSVFCKNKTATTTV